MPGELPEGRYSEHVNDAKMQRIRARVLIRARYVCAICGHGPQQGSPADGVDHIVPVQECATRGISIWDSKNMQPAHSKKPCLYCMSAAAERGYDQPGNRAGYCNALRGSGSMAYVRAKIANRTGLRIVDTDPGSDGRMPAETGEREW